jgi:signal transduction histidine kinase
MTNAVKHARAVTILLEMRFSPDVIGLRVCDDGIGFLAESAAAGAASGHFGLLGMRERANKVGGSLAIESAPGNGTIVDLSIPLASSLEFAISGK